MGGGALATSREHYVADSMAVSETVVLLLRIGVPWSLVQQDLQRCGEKEASWDPSGLTKGAASACLVPLLSSPGLVPAVHGPWAVAGGTGCSACPGWGMGHQQALRGPLPCPLHGCICLFPPQGEGLHQLREALKILAERVLILETMIGLYGE